MRAKKTKPASRRASENLAAGEPLGETMALLALAAPAIDPPARVKAQLFARLRPPPTALAADWQFGSVAGATGWVPLPFPGVRMREVTIDAVRDTALLYVEMTAGAIFPDHEHTATERGIVLSGDLRMGERTLGAGDFYEAAAGTRHQCVASPSGCTGLLWVGAEAWKKWRAALVAAPRR